MLAEWTAGEKLEPKSLKIWQWLTDQSAGKMAERDQSMKRRQRRQFTDEQKRMAVDDYVSGRKTAEQVAAENDVNATVIYKWRVQLDEKAKGARVDELESQGLSTQAARKILQLEAEVEEYQKKVAQQAVIIDLLKKLQPSTTSQPESELTGLIDTAKRLARSRKPSK